MVPIITVDNREVQHLRERDWRLAHLIDYIGPLEYKKPESAFCSLAHSIIEQMLSMKSAATIESRISSLCGGQLSSDIIATVSLEKIRECGVSRRKASNLQALAKYANEHDLESLSLLSEENVRQELLSLPGIGKWTCDMFLLFYLEKEDILPLEDGAFRHAFKWLYGVSVESEDVQHVVCDLWKPYSSTAARYLYRALNTGVTRSMCAIDLMPLEPGVSCPEFSSGHN